MRLALIGPSAPYRGGIVRYHDHLAAALAARGHRVRRISFRRLYPGLLFPGRTQYEPPEPGGAAAMHPAREAIGATEPAQGLPAPEPLIDSVSPASWWRAARAAAQAEVMVCQWWHPFFAPALATIALLLRRRVPAIFVCHNLAPHEPLPAGTVLTRLGFAPVAAFVAQSAADGASLRDRYPKRPVTVILPPAVTPVRCTHGHRTECARTLGLPPARQRALFFGYVRRYKGLPTLIAALSQTRSDVQLVVAGEIYHRDATHYRSLAERHGVAERVVLLDRFLPEREVWCCFAAADVVVLPYWQASQSAVVPLAMACGRAVVATTVGGLPDLVRPGETGLLVPPRDPAALVSALERAFEAAPAWGAAAAVAARAMTWESAAAALESLAASLISPPRSPCVRKEEGGRPHAPALSAEAMWQPPREQRKTFVQSNS